MGTNSIRANLCYKDIVSTIKLEMGNDLEKRNTYVLIEGYDDKQLFKYLCSENVVIYESYSGKKGIEEILKVFNNNPRILGIRDKDYETRSLDNRIFFYDYSCMEMMLININTIFESIACEYYDGSLDYQTLRYEILKKLKKLSVLRKINEEYRKMWNFNGLYIDSILENTEINEEKLYKKLSEINDKEIIEDEIIKREYNKEDSYEEFLYLTSGHDFVDLFLLYCKNANGRNIAYKCVLHSIRCACILELFKQTKLYNKLKEYQVKNGVMIIN